MRIHHGLCPRCKGHLEQMAFSRTLVAIAGACCDECRAKLAQCIRLLVSGGVILIGEDDEIQPVGPVR